jgi:hypothetical protein
MFPVMYDHYLHLKSKAIPVTGRGGLQGCDMLRIPHCLDNRLTDGGEVVSLTHRQRFAHRGEKERFLMLYFCILSHAV